MALYFPDLNVWLALSDRGHVHSSKAWEWLGALRRDARLVFSRYTHIGLLRLLTNRSVMGDDTLTLRDAWRVYDSWLNDPRVEFYPEPRELEKALRGLMAPFADKPASQWVGDCYLLAYAEQSGAALATFDKALFDFARKKGHRAVIPG